MKNILFPTVRQGNCGDEFIFMGVKNLIDSMQPEYNPIILNKNVEACRRLALRGRAVNIETDSGEKVSLDLEQLCFMKWPSLHDNSFADYHELDFIDAVVFAGTPEWMGFKLDHLYRKLRRFEGPILFLGVGFHEGLAQSGPYAAFAEKPIHQAARVFTVRDRLLYDFVKKEVAAVQLPCPALLCAPNHKKRTAVKRIGFSLQGKKGQARANYVPEATYDFSLKLLRVMARYFECEVVCHWIEDLVHINNEIGHEFTVRYTYDAKDYLRIYDRYDLVIGTRVHGSGMAASLGIPSYTIAHSLRSDTVMGFLSRLIAPTDDVEEIVAEVQALDLAAASAQVIAHKKETLAAYQALLDPHFPL